MKRCLFSLSLLVCFSCSRSSHAPAPKPEPLRSAFAETPKGQHAVKKSESTIAPTAFDLLRASARSNSLQSIHSFQRYLFAKPDERLWSSFGLGRHCSSMDTQAVSSLLAQAVSLWMADAERPSPQLLNVAAWALGSCAQADSEVIFRPWLSGESQTNTPELVTAGAFGLATLVDHGRQLSERTQTAILDAAQRENRSELLLPLGRLSRLSEAVGAHLLEVAGAFLTQSNVHARRQAIFALGAAGPSAAAPLREVLVGHQYSVQERAAASQALSQLGRAGQMELDLAVRDLLARGLPKGSEDPLWIPLLSAITYLQNAQQAQGELRKLQSVVLAEGSTHSALAQRRRLIQLRCRAAALLVGAVETHPMLLQCDPQQGPSFALAQLQVLGRGDIVGTRAQLYHQHITSEDVVISEAALRLLPSHPEIEDAAQLLLLALETGAFGQKTLASQIISAQRERIDSASEAQRASVISALEKIISNSANAPQETRAAAIDAAGALGVLSLKPVIKQVCDGSEPLLWPAAARALQLMGEAKAECSDPVRPLPQSLDSQIVVDAALSEPATLIIDSDLGELRLIVETAMAPIAAAHFLKKVDAGFYDHQRIGFGRYGFTAQFGDPDQDGYEQELAPGLPFEVSPLAFDRLSFGLASFAPGAENAQIFVALSDAPQLFGSRVRLGRAEGPFELLIFGDELHTVKRLTK